MGARAARSGAVLRRLDVRGARCFDPVIRRRAGAARSHERADHGRSGVRGVRRRADCVARRQEHLVRRGRRRRHRSARFGGGGSPPGRRGGASRRAGRGRGGSEARRTARGAARLPQPVDGDRPPCAPPTHAAARSRRAAVGCGGRIPAGARGRRRRCGRGDIRARGYAREPAGAGYVHRGPDGLRAFYEHLFSNDGGIPLEHCRVMDDGRACALEYNVVRWGSTELPPEAGVAVYVRSDSGKLAAARIYDDCDPPLGP